MFISHKYKVIFVHVQRTGGNSIHKLFQESDPDLVETLPVTPSLKGAKHCFLTDIRDAIDGDIFNGYLKFCVARHPVTRMISWHLKLKEGRNKDDTPVKPGSGDKPLRIYIQGVKFLQRIAFLKNERVINCWRNCIKSLNYFESDSRGAFAMMGADIGYKVIKEVHKNAKNFDEFINLPKNHESGLFKRFHFNQFDYISDDGVLLADRILKFENIDSDFQRLSKEIGLEGKLPHLNKSGAKKKETCSKETKKIIFKRFEKDFKYFGYQL